MRYVFPAKFIREDGVYYVRFPDLENCFTDGKDIPDALDAAADVLNLMLCGREDNRELIPEPSDIKTIQVADNEFTSLIEADTAVYRQFISPKPIKKTLTIPSYLNAMAEKEGVNFSAVLQEALKARLGV